MKDYLIIGGGLAGLSFALTAHNHSKTFHIVDKHLNKNSSSIAAGIINPITGKQIKLSWQFEAALDIAKKFYQQAESYLEQVFYTQTKILRLFQSEEEVLKLRERLCDENYKKYINVNCDIPDTIESITNAFEIAPAYHLDTDAYLKSFYKKFANEIIKAEFDLNQISLGRNSIKWNNQEYKYVILATGHEADLNVGFRNAKGEILTLDVPDLNLDFIVNSGIFILPYSGYYKIGATYSWDKLDSYPTMQARNELLEKFEKLCKLPYKVLEHQAAVRPIVHGRKPVCGQHGILPICYAINGLGSKGALYGPYVAKILFDHIESGSEIPEELSLKQRIKDAA